MTYALMSLRPWTLSLAKKGYRVALRTLKKNHQMGTLT